MQTYRETFTVNSQEYRSPSEAQISARLISSARAKIVCIQFVKLSTVQISVEQPEISMKKIAALI